MNLENKLFFRIVKVAYVLSIPAYFILALTILVLGWQELTTSGVQTGNFSDWIMQKDRVDALLGLIVIFPVYFSLVNLTKETLIYLAFGRKFALYWVDIIGYCLAIIIIPLIVAGSFIHPTTDTIKTTSKTMTKHFHVGQKVHHKIFGIGTVIDRKGDGEDMILRVRFERADIGTKSLIASYVE